MKRTLSRKEWLVACCYAAGMTAEQTGVTLKISVHTTQTYRSRIRRKLNTRGSIDTAAAMEGMRRA